jgi:hypothetical protein
VLRWYVQSEVRKMDPQDPGRPPLQGHYANYFQAGYNQAEFVIDCGQLFEGDVGVLMHTRLIVGPLYAKALVEILSRSVAAYEARYGMIEPT